MLTLAYKFKQYVTRSLFMKWQSFPKLVNCLQTQKNVEYIYFVYSIWWIDEINLNGYSSILKYWLPASSNGYSLSLLVRPPHMPVDAGLNPAVYPGHGSCPTSTAEVVP